jgi:RNA polymerase sigma factor (sigma-70 family)
LTVGQNPRSSRVIRGAFRVNRRVDATDETLFLSNLPVINDVVARVCRRHHLSAGEAEEFAAELRLHLIERNYEPLRKFEGRCSLRTYLMVLVQHFFYDYRNRLWGKWRPSAEAGRLGPAAILLERLVTRDGWSVEQATEILKTNHGVSVDETLARLALSIAKRQPSRQIVPEREAEEIESAAAPPDANVVSAEQNFLAKRVYATLDRARQALSPDERLILKMQFDDGVSVADIARALGLNQKRLYRTVTRILAKLRERLEADGMSKEEIRALFADATARTS